MHSTKCEFSITTSVDVVTATWTQLVPARNREHITVPYRGTNFRIKYQELQPTSATDGFLIDSNYPGDYQDSGFVMVTNVWVYQTSGSDLAVDCMEAFLSKAHANL